jgi:predicted ATP-grasp superfamily ATP-dependent carboligase
MLQEYIPGPASRHYFIDGFVDRQGEIRAVFARQRMRMYPLDFGDSSYMTTVPTGRVAQAVDSLKKLLPAVDYRGIFSAEFKLDGRDDTYKLIEVNTRPWTYINFDSVHGMNMAAMSYRDALGGEVPTVTTYDLGASMVYLPNDLGACWALWRRADISLVGWLASWMKARSAVFSIRDPLPSLAWWWNVMSGRLRKLFSRRKVER